MPIAITDTVVGATTEKRYGVNRGGADREGVRRAHLAAVAAARRASRAPWRYDKHGPTAPLLMALGWVQRDEEMSPRSIYSRFAADWLGVEPLTILSCRFGQGIALGQQFVERVARARLRLAGQGAFSRKKSAANFRKNCPSTFPGARTATAARFCGQPL